MKIQWKNLITCLAIPLAVGGLSAALTGDNISLFASINKPDLTPSGWVFPVAWTILYVLMGIASYLVVTSEKENDKALAFYGIQLVFNFFWPILFFHLQLYLMAFIWLVLLWLLVLKTTVLFYEICKTAGYLMIPYLLWITFAGYLNLLIYFLN